MGFVEDPKSAKLGTWKDAELSQMLPKLTFLGDPNTARKGLLGDLKSENWDSWGTPWCKTGFF